MSLTVSYCLWQSLTVSIELLHVSDCLLWLLAFCPRPSGPFELLHVCHVSHCISLFVTVSLCLSSPMELLHLSHCSWLSLTVSTCAMELLNVSHCLF